VERVQTARHAAADEGTMSFEVGTDDAVAGEVEGAGKSEAFGHARAGDEDGAAFEGWGGLQFRYSFARGMRGEAGAKDQGPEKDDGVDGEEDETESDEGEVLEEVEVVG